MLLGLVSRHHHMAWVFSTLQITSHKHWIQFKALHRDAESFGDKGGPISTEITPSIRHVSCQYSMTYRTLCMPGRVIS